MLRMIEIAGLGAGETLFGGKAAGLSRLRAAGARVPAGFAVEATLDGVESWAAADRQRLLDMARGHLEAGPVAVRSSAVGEDSAERSFAGLFETVLGVRTPEELLAAAGTCVASGAAERVLSYAKRPEALPVGIVVQRMVSARAAGVCFTRDPSGRDAAILVEAVAGTGDQLVSGRSNPERWRVYATGLGDWDCRRRGSCGALESAEAARIAGEARDLAHHFRMPLDLEWALDAEGTLWWLQARPITTSLDTPVEPEIERAFPEADDGPVTVWSNWNVSETLPDPLSPLAWDLWREQVLPFLARQLFGVRGDSPLGQSLQGFDLVGGRLYINMNAFLALPILGFLSRRALHVVDARIAGPIDRLVREGVLRPRRLAGSRFGLSLRMGAATLGGLVRLARGFRPERGLAALERAALAIDARPDVSILSNGELLEEMRLWLRPESGALRDGLQMEGVAILVYSVAAHAFRKHPRAKALLATGITANPTTRISIAIDDLVLGARPLEPLFLEPLGAQELLERLGASVEGREWRDGLTAFLSKNGHRGPMEFDIGARRWAEDPTMILDLVRAGLRAHPAENVRQRMERLGLERRRAIDEAVATEPIWKRPLLRRLARRVERHMPLREAPKHYGIFVFRRIRQAAAELGKRLAHDGMLRSGEDVFFLTSEELRLLAGGVAAPGGLKAQIDARKERLARFRRIPAPDFVRSDGVPVYEDEPEDETSPGVLRGTAVSSGTAEGPVLVLREPDPRRVNRGDILVFEFADPGWTPLFAHAAGVVMEVGGMMCHAAVVAREMGVPAVFAVRNATSLLRDGERVAIDGTKGTVTRLETAPPAQCDPSAPAK